MLFNLKASFSASTETLSSVTSTSSSSTLLKSFTQPKNYSSAFAALQNQYGFGGSAPAPTTLPKASMAKSTNTSVAVPAAQPTSKATKNYEAAYGALSSSYGFGGVAVPSSKTSSMNKK